MAGPVIIMAAPNGARKTKKEHPNLPVTIEEISVEAARCYNAGAVILHAHVRDVRDACDTKAPHVLDAGLYKELIAEVHNTSPDMLIQITTEAVGRYSPEDQMNIVKAVMPDMVSVALREILPQGPESCTDISHGDIKSAQAFYHWAAEANIHVQHILYDAQDVHHFLQLQQSNIIPAKQNCVLYVLGRYAEQQIATPEDLDPFLSAAEETVGTWFCCAFGPNEHACMMRTVKQGGHIRVGFENNMHLESGEIAESTAALIKQTHKALKVQGIDIANSEAAKRILSV